MQQKVGPAAIAVVVVIVLVVIGIIGWKVFGPTSAKTVGKGQDSGNTAYDAYNKDTNNGPKMGGGGNYSYGPGTGGGPKGSPTLENPRKP